MEATMKLVHRVSDAPVARWDDVGPHDHFVQFYEAEADLVDAVGDWIGRALASGGSAIVIATAQHERGIEGKLVERGIDLSAARNDGRYVARDARGTLDMLLVEGWPDAHRFASAIEPLVAAASASSRVAIFGEMVALLWNDGKAGAAVRLEELWNELAAKYPFSLCCAYSMSEMAAGPHAEMHRVCAAHQRVIPAESYNGLATESERLARICELQQRAAALEREIAHRKASESILAKRERELSDFLEHAPQALHSVAADGTIVWANACELAMVGYRADEYVGRNIADFHVDRVHAEAILRRLASGETLRDEPAQLRAKDGSIRDVLVTSNVRWEEGAFVRTRCFTRDVTAQRRAERALRESEGEAGRTRALLAAIVESSDDAIIGKSLDGRIMSWNAGAARVFGYTADEAIGRPITMLIPAELRHEEDHILAKLARGERVDHYETQRLTKGGARIDVSLTISPVHDEQGRVVAISKVARDVTERKRLEATLRDAHRRKDEFIAMLGHELRNPLAPIRNVAEVLRRTSGGNAEAERLCTMLERQVQQMTRLLDDLLDVSRITQGKIRFHRESVDIGAVVQRAVEASRPLVDSRRHKLRVTTPKSVVRVDGDAARLVQLLTNLLNNAAKYTPEGGRIDLRVARRDQVVEIRVCDNGTGIAPDVLPRIFDLFMQADRTQPHSQEGLGIGLTLVRIIAEHHGGSVEVFSAGAGRGSEFVVKLPLGSSSARPESPVPAPQAPMTRKRIVIVDDNRDASQSLATMLRLSGHEVVVAADGPSAIETVRNLRPDLALLDIGLPGMDGYEVARRLRKEGCTVPLAALTGYGAPEDCERSRAAGFDHHFVKPIDPMALERLIASPVHGDRA
jgi:PAS domain S-box-containing protein